MGCCSSSPVLEPHNFQVITKPEEAEEIRVRKVLIIANPNSGGRRGLQVLADVENRLREVEGLEVVVEVSSYPGHTVEVARTTDLTGVDVLCTIGGDGTFYEALNGMMSRTDDTRVPICVIPAGSGNSFSYDLNVLTHMDAVEALLRGRVRRVDMLEVSTAESSPAGPSTVDEGEAAAPKQNEAADAAPTATGEVLYAINLVGWGLSTAVMHSANSLRWMGGAQYTMAAYLTLLRNPEFACDVKYIDAEGVEVERRMGYTLIHCQHTVHVGDHMRFCPDAKMDDGLLDLVLVQSTSRGNVARFLEAAKVGTHVDLPFVEYVQAKEVMLRPTTNALTGPNSLNVDGELAGYSPCRVRVLPRALRVIA